MTNKNRNIRITKRDIREGKVFTFWIYDLRTRAKENIWAYVLSRHDRCEWEAGKLTQDRTLPKIRLARFLCFNCLNANHCYWASASEEALRHHTLISKQEAVVRWYDEGENCL